MKTFSYLCNVNLKTIATMARYKVKLIYHTYIEVEVDADSRTSALEKAEDYTAWEMPDTEYEDQVVLNLSRCDEEVIRLTD